MSDITSETTDDRHICDYPVCSVRGAGHPLACNCRSWQRPAPTKIAQAGVLEQIKLLALTAGSPGELSMHLTLSRIVRLCIDAGIKAHLVELKELHHGN